MKPLITSYDDSVKVSTFRIYSRGSKWFHYTRIPSWYIMLVSEMPLHVVTVVAPSYERAVGAEARRWTTERESKLLL